MVLMRDRTDSEGRHPIYLRVSDRGKRGHFATGFWAFDKQFVDGKSNGRYMQGRGIPQFNVIKTQGSSTKTISNKDANDELSALETRLNNIIIRYSKEKIDWTFEMLRGEFELKPKRDLFLSYALDIIENEYIAGGHFQKADITKDAIDSLMKYDNNLGKKMFQDINVKYLQGYMDHCTKIGNAPGTISIRLREVRRIFNLAIIRDKIAPPECYPFSKSKDDDKIKIPKPEMNKRDEYLTKESLKTVNTSKSDSFTLERTKHLFLFSFFTSGINWKDMALLTKDCFYPAVVPDESTKEPKNVTMMEYRRSKTKKGIAVQVTPEIQRELDWFKENTPLYGDYVLPIISKDVKPEKLHTYIKQVRKRFNRYLKALAESIGLPEGQKNISIYSARHSFAMALLSNDKPIELISQALGHQSVETTKHYLAKFSTTKMADETSGLLDTKEEQEVKETERSEPKSNARAAERILELSKLVAEGLLTKEEFIKLKEDILISSSAV